MNSSSSKTGNLSEAGPSNVAQIPNMNDLLVERILEVCQKHDSISDSSLWAEVEWGSPGDRLAAVNQLLTCSKLEILRARGSTEPFYRCKVERNVAITSELESGGAEELVYGIIEEAGDKGIWVRNIRNATGHGLTLTALNKMLKNLESKKLIKAVTSVNQSKRKLYMLYNLTPDSSITGGAWYSADGFESEFVDVLNQQCYRFLKEKADGATNVENPIAKRNMQYASLLQVQKYITELGISKVALKVDDIEKILQTLIYDGKVESTIQASSRPAAECKFYRAVDSLLPSTGLMRTPCGICPVHRNCYPGGEVSPETCVYMTDWLNL